MVESGDPGREEMEVTVNMARLLASDVGDDEEEKDDEDVGDEEVDVIVAVF